MLQVCVCNIAYEQRFPRATGVLSFELVDPKANYSLELGPVIFVMPFERNLLAMDTTIAHARATE